MNDDRGRRRDDEPRDDAELDPSAWLSGQFAGDEPSDRGDAAGDGDDPATRALPVVDPTDDEGQEARVEPGAPARPVADDDDQGEASPGEPRDGGAPSSQPVVVPPPAPDPPRAEGHPQALDLAALRAAVDPGARPSGSPSDRAGSSTDEGPGPGPGRPSTPHREEDSGDVVPGPFTALIASQAVPGPGSAEPVAFDWDKVRSVARPEAGTARLDLPPVTPTTGPEASAGPAAPVTSDDAPDVRSASGDASAPPSTPVGPVPVEPAPEPAPAPEPEPEPEPAPEPAESAEPWWVDEHREMTRRERRLAEAAGLSVPPAVAPTAAPAADEERSPGAAAGAPADTSGTGSGDGVDPELPGPPAGSEAAAGPIDVDDDPAPVGASGSWSLSSGGDLPDVAATGDVVLEDDDLPGSPGPSAPEGDDARADVPSTGLATGWPFASPGAVDPASDAPLTTPRDEPSFTELLGIVPPAPAPAPAPASEADPSPTTDTSDAERDEDERGDEEPVDPDDAVSDDGLDGAGLDGAGLRGDGTSTADSDAASPLVVDEDDESEGIDDPAPGGAAPRAAVAGSDDVVPDGVPAPADRGDADPAAEASADVDDRARVDPPTAVLGAPVAAASASAAPGPGAVGEPLGIVPTGVVPAPVSRSAPATERDGRPRDVTPAADALPGVSASAGGPSGGAGRASGARGARRRPSGAEVEAWARQHVVLLAVVAGVVLLLALVALFFLSRGIAGAAAAGSAGGASVAAVAEPSPTVTRTVTAEPVAPVEEPVAAGPLPAGVHSWQDLQGGECLAAFPDAWQQEYEVVDCAASHAAQLTALVQLDGDAASAWPGLEALQAEVPTRCTADGALDRGAAGAYTGVQLSASYPATAEDWAAGDRRYACFVSREGAQPLTSSLAPAAG